MKQEVLARFGAEKRADLAGIIPAVAGAPLGGFIGRAIGARYNRPDFGTLLGSIGGGVAGQAIREKLQDPPQAAQVPLGAPFALDPTNEDIPPWALAGAHMVRPAIEAAKSASYEENPADMVLGEIPGYAAVQGARHSGLRGALKGTLGQAAGGVAAGLGGHLLGTGLEKLIGHHVNVPYINISLPELLAGVTGTIGATKGFRAALG